MAEKEKDNSEEQAAEFPKETEASEAKPKSRKLIYASAAIIVVAVIAAVILIGPQLTGQVSGDQDIADANVVKAGDTVKVSYTGTLLSGEEFDSGEISFEVGAGQMIEGFDEALVGMEVGEEKEITVPPEKGYGKYDESKIITENLRKEIDKVDEVPMTVEQFESAVGEAPVVGSLYETPWAPWDLKVLEIGEGSITIEHMPLGGQTISLSYGTGTVTLKGDKLVITVDPEIGKTISTAYGQATILEGDNQSEVKVDFNHELAGKTLVFSIKVLEIEDVEEVLKKLSDFVTCLDEKGMKIYGANWCGWTKKLVESLGGFDNVSPIYVECTEETETCQQEGVEGYPTIKINGERYMGDRGLDALGEATGCTAPSVGSVPVTTESNSGGSC